MQLEIDGLDELINFLEDMQQNTEPAINEALIAGGDYLRDRVKSEVYSHGLTKRSGEAEKAIVRTDPINNELFVGTEGGKRKPGYYLYMHEFGYWNVQARRFIPAKPLVSTVYERSKSRILEKYAEVFRKRYGL